MYSFIGLNAIRLMDEGKVSQLPYDILTQLVSGEYYIDLPEELVLGMIVDWANTDFQVNTKICQLYFFNFIHSLNNSVIPCEKPWLCLVFVFCISAGLQTYTLLWLGSI